VFGVVTAEPNANVPLPPPVHPVKLVAVIPVHVTVCSPGIPGGEVLTRILAGAAGKPAVDVTLIVAWGSLLPADAAAIAVVAVPIHCTPAQQRVALLFWDATHVDCDAPNAD
jgi:hypothetical protein